MHCSQSGGAPHFIGIETWATAGWFMRAVARALLQKALLSFRVRGELSGQQLYGHWTVQSRIVSAVDQAHSTLSEQAFHSKVL